MTALIQNKPVMSICESKQNVNNLYENLWIQSRPLEHKLFKSVFC